MRMRIKAAEGTRAPHSARNGSATGALAEKTKMEQIAHTAYTRLKKYNV